jgi:hypothetical protein
VGEQGEPLKSTCWETVLAKIIHAKVESVERGEVEDCRVKALTVQATPTEF